MGAFMRKMMIAAALCGIFGCTLSACGGDSGSSASDEEIASSSSENDASSSSKDVASSAGAKQSSSSGKEIASSSSSRENAKVSSSSEEDDESSSSKNVASSSGTKQSSSSGKEIASSSAKATSSSDEAESSSSSKDVVVSSSSAKQSSSSEYVPFDHSIVLAGDYHFGGNPYKTFTDERNGRSYYYMTFKSTKTGDSVTVMVENLNIGEMVPGAEDQTDDMKIERYCYNDDTTRCDKYGGLYQ